MKAFLILFFCHIYYAKTENLTVTDGISCCPPGYLVSARIKPIQCRNTNNDTMPMRVSCNDTLMVRNFSVTPDNQIGILLHQLHTYYVGSDKACIANMMSIKKKQIVQMAIMCINDEDNQEMPYIASEVLGYCMIVTVVFLLLTVIVYSILRELRDLLGKSIINFCGSLALGMGILAIMRLVPYEDMDLCAARGFLVYFFLIAAFFWTTAISVQVLLSTRSPVVVDRGWKEFIWYALFAWGCPVILTVILAIVNYHPGTHTRPGIGLNHCWFFDKRQQWIYMYSVMSILLLVNIVIFIYTSTIVWRHSFASSHMKALKYKFAMTTRLIILMGLPWVFEMIGSLAPKHIVWAILDIFNTLQGILIFLLLVVFRKRAVKAMYSRGWLDCISGIVEKFLAATDDAEENAIQHTDVPMNDRQTNCIS